MAKIKNEEPVPNVIWDFGMKGEKHRAAIRIGGEYFETKLYSTRNEALGELQGYINDLALELNAISCRIAEIWDYRCTIKDNGKK